MKAILVTHRDSYKSTTPFPPIGSIGTVLAGPDYEGDYDILFPEWPCFVEDPSWVLHKTMLVFIDDGHKSSNSVLAAVTV